MFHQWIALGVFILFSLIGVGLTIVGIGGTFLVLIGALLYNLVTWSMAISMNTLLWIAGLAILGELLEWIITFAGMKKSGASGYALAGTILGAIIGGMALSIIPIIGTIIGLIAGAIIGAFALEYYHTGHAQKAWKAAKAALVGRALVSLSKFTIAIIQIAIILKTIT